MYSNQNMKQSRQSKSTGSNNVEAGYRVAEDQGRYGKANKKEGSKQKNKFTSVINKMNLVI